jgi:ABC-2 type transport system permease protein
MSSFSFARLLAILIKEFIQMRRDRGTFAVMVGVPVLQMLAFGFAINTDPKHLPAAIHIADDSIYARSIEAAISWRWRPRRKLATACSMKARFPSSSPFR